MKIGTKDTRQHILDTGYQLIAGQGFSNVGLSQILKHADVPKGSFYHYFKSKEQFGEALINDYFDDYQLRIDARFNSDESTAYDRLIGYWQCWVDVHAEECSLQKCLVVKLSAEVSDLSEPMRLALLNGATKIIGSISQCIDDGIKEGSISPQDADETAELLYNLWLGASLMSKLRKNSDGLDRVMSYTQSVLKKERTD
jgi:TetR/AcrR family transcriptional repressor of nem operon